MSLIDIFRDLFSSVHFDKEDGERVVYAVLSEGNTPGQIALAFTRDSNRWVEMKPLNEVLQVEGAERHLPIGTKLRLPPEWFRTSEQGAEQA